jgi:hypothetical protein
MHVFCKSALGLIPQTRANIPNYVITKLLLILQLLPSWYNAFIELYKIFLERHTINSNPRFANDLHTAGAEGPLLLVAACSPPRPCPHIVLVAGFLLLLLVIVVVVVGSLL